CGQFRPGARRTATPIACRSATWRSTSSKPLERVLRRSFCFPAMAKTTPSNHRLSAKRCGAAAERSQAYERVPADGPIVRFLIVFTKAIRKAFPAEPEARGDAIRWWLWHYWGPKRNRFSLDIDFST